MFVQTARGITTMKFVNNLMLLLQLGKHSPQ